MKHCRLLAITLILVLISSPAMAAMCAAKCAGGELIGAMHAGNPAVAGGGSHHCEQQADPADKHQQHAEHKSCNMAGCHVSASAAFISPAQFVSADFSHGVLAYFAPPAINAELPPPIKPPA